MNNWTEWIAYKWDMMYDIWSVEIPKDAYVYVRDGYYKTSSIVLKNKRSIWYNENLYADIVKRYGNTYKYIKTQDYKSCLDAVKHYGCALKFVKNKTDEICLTAVKQNINALEFVEDQKYKMCLASVKDPPNVYRVHSSMFMK